MQFRALALCVFWTPSVLALAAPTSDALPEPVYNYEVLPNRPNYDQAAGQAVITAMASQWSSTEAVAFATQASIAADAQSADRAKLVATDNAFQLSTAARNAGTAASRLNALRLRAQAVSLDTREMINSIPAKTDKAVQRAIEDTVASAIARMNAEVKREVAMNRQDQGMVNTAALRFAADRAQIAALPLQKAKLRKFQTVYDDISQEQGLGVVVTELKQNAFEMANQAVSLQAQGENNLAGQLHAQAEDALTVAGKMADQAHALHHSADQLRLDLNSGDAAANAAAAYASYKASLNATKLEDLPPPPIPLTLPPPIH